MAKNAAERTSYLAEVRKEEPAGSKKVYIGGEIKRLPTFDVKIENLIFNKENGRIRTKVLTHEKLRGPLDQELRISDENMISDFIWNSSKSKNKQTKESLSNFGQETPLVVTADGVVVGGNRRLCCMRKIADFDLCEAVILDDRYDGDKRKLLRLEKQLQHGIDAQEDYNANEKYYECLDLVKAFGAEKDNKGKYILTTEIINEITTCMPRYKAATDAASKRLVQDDLKMAELFDEYLSRTGSEGVLTQLDKKEGYFVDLFPSTKKYKADDDSFTDRPLTRREIAKWKEICFVITKGQFQSGEESTDSKAYRKLFKVGKSENGGRDTFFGNSRAWEFIQKEYDIQIKPLVEKQKSFEELKTSSENPLEELKNQEEIFQQEIKGPLTGIWNRANIIVEEELSESLAEKRVRDAYEILQKINLTDWPPEEYDDSLINVCNELRQISAELYKAIK